MSRNRRLGQDQWFRPVLISRIPFNGSSYPVIEPNPKDLADPFVIYLSENLFENGIRAILKMKTGEKAECVISLLPVAEPQRYGIAELSEDGKKVLRSVEKPREPRSNLAVIGVYELNASFFEVYPRRKPSWRNEMGTTEALTILISEGFKVVLHNVQGWWKDTGKP